MQCISISFTFLVPSAPLEKDYAIAYI